MPLLQNDVHVIIASLRADDEKSIQQYLALLSKDEIERADRFYFPIHRNRFILARGILREILSYYLNFPPAQITIFYDQYQKPYQLINQNLHFNVSHSEDFVVYAISTSILGVDTEKVQTNYQHDVAKRFFSQTETQQLFALPEKDAIRHFYRIWAKKEAIVKAIGHGLGWSLSSFSVSLENTVELISTGDYQFSLHPLLLNKDYESALAVQPPINKISYYQWENTLIALQLV